MKLNDNNIDNKIYVISQTLDLFDAKIYKYFPTKRLISTKKKLYHKLFNLYVYGIDE